MRRTLEIFFRHLLLLLIPLVLFPITGVAIAYNLVPRTYQTTASLWALHRYQVISPTGPESDLSATPAETQATALTELLQTRAFALSVAQGIDLAPTLGLSDSVLNDPQQLQSALASEIAKNVAVASQGYNLFTISYTNRNPQIAQQVLESVIQNYGSQSLSLSTAEGQNLLQNYQAQLQQAQQQQNQAITAQERYAAAHRNLTQAQLAVDPQYQQLDDATKQAEANVQNIQNEINAIQQSIAANNGGPSTLFQVVDAPRVPILPVSRTKNYLTSGGIGAGIALLADILYLVILVRRDRSIYTAYDLQDILSLPVLIQLPTLAASSVAHLVDSKGTERG